ncbi:MAG: hypothetical protein Pg6C_02400 [Treponemataceae bacterium]|nr:MAG: hypothetical protein Pg6C_02400 [Treponemataceae bacterium]
MRPYHHYSMEERSILQNFHAAGKGVREIARETGRSPSSVSRELKRNGNRDGTYHAWRGMSLYLHRQKRRVRKRRLSEGAARDYAAGRLRDGRPPEAVAERWRRERTGDIEGDTLHGGIGQDTGAEVYFAEPRPPPAAGNE